MAFGVSRNSSTGLLTAIVESDQTDSIWLINTSPSHKLILLRINDVAGAKYKLSVNLKLGVRESTQFGVLGAECDLSCPRFS